MTEFARGKLAVAMVACPHCKARIGTPCHRPDWGDVCPPHRARRRALDTALPNRQGHT